MNLTHVEHAVATIRAQLMECALQDDWSDHGVAKVVDAIRGCVQQIAAAQRPGDLAVERRLSRETLRRVVCFVNGNLDTKLRWDDIAAHVGMDRYVLGKQFKLSTGMTLHEYVVRTRVRRAMNLLAHTDRSIVDIALDVGCACQSHFTTLFRKRTGTTPAAFRSAAAGTSAHAGVVRAVLQAAEPAFA